jgi:DNA-directed RNA polymerase subunit RPC12/RpoP
VTVTWPTADTRWRCRQCGNKTRFDVVRSSRVKEFVHLDLSGKPEVEETEVLSETLEEVRCRWCGATGTIELVDRPVAEADDSSFAAEE